MKKVFLIFIMFYSCISLTAQQHNLYTDAIMLSLEEDKVKKGDTIVFLYKYYLDSTVTISPKGVVISYLEENQMDSLVKKNSYFVFYSVSPITFYNEEMYISVTGAGTILEKEINGIKYMRTSVGDHYDYRLKYNIFKRRFRLKKAIPHFRGLNLFY